MSGYCKNWEGETSGVPPTRGETSGGTCPKKEMAYTPVNTVETT